MMKISSSRIWELDVLRGLAVCLMVTQHIAVINSLVTGSSVSISPIFTILGRTAAALFLLLVGISSVLSYRRRVLSGWPTITYHFLYRGIQLLALGAVITSISVFVVPSMPIYFGILHFIGTTVCLLPLLLKRKVFRRCVVVGISLVSVWLPSTEQGSWWLVPVGAPPPSFTSLDYWPLVPWILLVMIGVEIGEVLYKSNNSLFNSPVIANSQLIRIMQWLGRHSLAIYFLHFPVVVLVAWLLDQVR